MRDPDRFGRDFYDRIFALAPTVRPLFPADLSHQRDKLLRALAMLVRGLDQPETLVPALRQLGARHVGYGVQAVHYGVVGEALIDTLDALCDPPMDAATRQAWSRLYGWIAATMIEGAEAAAATSSRRGEAHVPASAAAG